MAVVHTAHSSPEATTKPNTPRKRKHNPREPGRSQHQPPAPEESLGETAAPELSAHSKKPDEPQHTSLPAAEPKTEIVASPPQDAGESPAPQSWETIGSNRANRPCLHSNGSGEEEFRREVDEAS